MCVCVCVLIILQVNLPGVALLTGAEELDMTGVTLGGGSPAAISSSGWMMSLLKTMFFCHRLRTLTILLCMSSSTHTHRERGRREWRLSKMAEEFSFFPVMATTL